MTSNIQDIKRIADHRSLSQTKLDQRNRLANSKYREQPYDKGYDNPKQFTQRPRQPSNQVDNA